MDRGAREVGIFIGPEAFLGCVGICKDFIYLQVRAFGLLLSRRDEGIGYRWTQGVVA